jgi:hypothetical protein
VAVRKWRLSRFQDDLHRSRLIKTLFIIAVVCIAMQGLCILICSTGTRFTVVSAVYFHYICIVSPAWRVMAAVPSPETHAMPPCWDLASTSTSLAPPHYLGLHLIKHSKNATYVGFTIIPPSKHIPEGKNRISLQLLIHTHSSLYQTLHNIHTRF